MHIFDSNGRLLVQQRAKSKLTFPLLWANTCCSHPLYNIKEEVGEDSGYGILFLEIEL